jgi:hypothetical protein
MKKIFCFLLLCSVVSYGKPILTQNQGNILVDYYVTNQFDLWYSYCKSNKLPMKRCLMLCSNYSINPTYNTFGKSKDEIYVNYINWYKSKDGLYFRGLLLKEGIRCSVEKDKSGYAYLYMR